MLGVHFVLRADSHDAELVVGARNGPMIRNVGLPTAICPLRLGPGLPTAIFTTEGEETTLILKSKAFTCHDPGTYVTNKGGYY